MKYIKSFQIVNEAAKIETERYVRSHGKKPKGYGGWMFSYNRDGSDEWQIPNGMSWPDAQKWAKEKAKEDGEDYVYVMESLVTEAKNTIGLAFKEEQDYLDFKEFVAEQPRGAIRKNIGFDSKTKSWNVEMDVKVLDSIYGEGTPSDKKSGWYGGLPDDFESVIIESVNEAKDNLYLQLHKKYAEQIKGLKAKKIKKLTDLVSVQRRSMEDREDYFDMDPKKKKELTAEYAEERKLFKKYMGRDYSVMLPKGTESLRESSAKDGGDKSNGNSHHDDHTDNTVAQHWKDIYGEEFHSKYPAVAKIVKQRNIKDKRELKRIWDETYGENFEEQYPALYNKLD